jgi:hypothetical protein
MTSIRYAAIACRYVCMVIGFRALSQKNYARAAAYFALALAFPSTTS